MTFAVADRSDVRLRPSPFERLLDQQDLSELTEVLTAARGLLGEGSIPLDQVEDFPSAGRALDAAWQAIRAALATAGTAREHVMNSTDLLDLLDRVRHLDSTVRDAEARRRHDALKLVRSALNRFQTVESMNQLVQLAPEVICQLGFDRAIISRIQDSMWVTQAVHIPGDAEWADAVCEVGSANPQPLGPTIRETEMVRRRTPLLVTDVQHDQKVHRPIADVSLSRSYVAAPVMLRSAVVGFLHADRVFHRGDTDTFDRDMLALFAEGLSYALERTMLLGRVDAMRADVRRLASGIESSMSRFLGPDLTSGVIEQFDPFTVPAADDHGITLGPAPLPVTPARGGSDELSSRLTRREIQVVNLMAAGETNGRIATRLVLSEATVKSHVKHILRKLGAANRAEAVSRWLRAGNTAG